MNAKLSETGVTKPGLLSLVDLMDEDERDLQLRQWNATEAAYPREQGVHELFEAQAAAHPEAVAVEQDGHRISYSELDARSNQLARQLRRLGVAPGSRVALRLERSTELVLAQLAALKCGAAYVPLDGNAPAARQQAMLADSGASLLLSRSGLPGPEGEGARRVDMDALELSGCEWGSLGVKTPGEAAAYVMYTSGSTGEPKGVEVAHRGISRLVRNNGYADFNEHDRVAFAANPAFDASTLEVWAPLLNGGCVVVVDQATLLEPQRFAAALQQQRVSVLWLTAGLFSQYADALQEAFGGLRYLIVGGDAVDADVVERVLRAGGPAHLLNGYGPTETTTFATTFRVTLADLGANGIPIGRPIANTRIYLLDAQGQPAPVGAVGEIHIGGDGVARGYLNRPELTAERFLRDPFAAEAGARMYKTGDLGRYRADGNIEYLGRNDDQVKLRGFRIELGEIETQLRRCDGVKEAAVLAREDQPGDKRLVAYYSGEAEAEALREALRSRLPDYMAPAAYVRLEGLPLTANGKLDRKGLPAPEASSYGVRAYEAPQDGTEAALAEIWRELLGVERVGRHDHFFELGGHSLLAVRLVERMRQAGLAADVKTLFNEPTLAALAARVGLGRREAEVPANRIPADCARLTPEMLPLVELPQPALDRLAAGVPGGDGNVQDIYPLSPLQQGILYHHLAAEAGDPYLLQVLLGLSDRAGLDAFAAGLQQVVDRHDILRSAVAWEGLDEPVQIVWRQAPLSVTEWMLDPAAGDIGRQLRELHDPRQYRLRLEQAPLLRLACAWDEAAGHWAVLLMFHHLVMDHTTLEVLLHELRACLEGRGEALPEAVPYRNYVAQVRQGLSEAEHEAFFRGMLAGVTEATLPFGLSDVRGDGSDIEEARLAVAPALCRRVRAQAQRLGVSAASLYHLAWAHVLARTAGQDEVVLGTVLLGRLQGGAGADRALGMFINTLPLRIGAGRVGARAAVKAVHASLSGLLIHEHAPLALAQRCSGLAPGQPLFSALINYRHSTALPNPDEILPGVRVLWSEERTNYPLTLTVDDLGVGFELTVQAAAGIGAARVGGYLHAALDSLAQALEQAPEDEVARLPWIPAAELATLLQEWNATGLAYPREQGVHELFEAQAARTPDAIAVSDERGQLSYGELEFQANQLARHLRRTGVRPEQRVAICVERSFDQVIGLLGILKAGCAYVPLDPAYQSERLAYMLADCQPAAVVHQARTRSAVAVSPVPLIDMSADAWRGESGERLEQEEAPGQRAHHLAYVIYTSGSTGQPKGVMVEHQGVCNLAVAEARHFMVAPGCKVLQFASFSFDTSVSETMMALTSGACLHLAPHHPKPLGEALARLIGRHGITHMTIQPAVLATLPQCDDLSSLRVLIVAGEKVGRELVEQWSGPLRLMNAYGPTEATVCSTVYLCGGDSDMDPPIGHAIPNKRIYLLDDYGQPVPVGVVGEIHIGGDGVARGYLNRPELTAERFLRDPFAAEAGARMYKTGDLGRYRADGNIEYLGRNDDQVKLRGFRIELGEIETQLRRCDGVKEAAVLAREDQPGDKRLVAYYSGEAEAEALREALRSRLPDYMAPAAYVRLEGLPLTANGKLDRKGLPAPEASSYGVRAYEAPQDGTEAALAEIWRELLGVERVGRHDHFFELGGHSLLAVRLISQIRQRLGAELGVADVFAHAELDAQAQAVSQAAASVLPPLLPAERRGPQPLSFAQQRLWFLSQWTGGSAAYHIPLCLQLDGALDADALQWALDSLLARHAALRTVFEASDGAATQRVVEAGAFPLRIEAAGEDWRAQAEAEASAPFDLEAGPLIRGLLLRLAPERHALLLTMHHIVSDGWSLGVLMRELDSLYAARLAGGESPLPPLALQYTDYAAWQRGWLAEAGAERLRRYWRDTLEGAPALLALPTDYRRPAEQDHAGASIPLVLDAELSGALKALSQRHGVTLYMTLLAAWSVVLSRLSGQTDLVVGTPVANRTRAEVEGLVGFFVNTLALRLDLSGDPDAETLLRRVKAQTLAAQAHQELPFEQVVELAQPTRSLAHSPVFQAMFSWQQLDGLGAGLGGLRLTRVEMERRSAKFDLTLELYEAGGRIEGSLEYATSLFQEQTAIRHVAYLRRMLQAMV
nr:NRPS [Chromobacterium vaccinii]UTQ11571.1 NRPS [Chromobacterium vaccinii]